MAFPAFLDTCTLFGAYLCDTLLRLAEAEAFRPLWSADSTPTGRTGPNRGRHPVASPAAQATRTAAAATASADRTTARTHRRAVLTGTC
jgi:hypothetical protein